MADPDALCVRTYGHAGPIVAVLHGGPAACGSAAPIARALADDFRVLEPWQRASTRTPLTVARHVADLNMVLCRHCPDSTCLLVGESWGAMLALAYAAEHCENVAAIALVGCGTFDTASRELFTRTIQQRLDDDTRRQLARLEQDIPDTSLRMKAQFDVLSSVYQYEPFPTGGPDDPDRDDTTTAPPFDALAHTQTWQDMLDRQRDGTYPAAFSAINVPVIMFHGRYDPHPGAQIFDCLRQVMPQLEYHPFDNCGHQPWRERACRASFFNALRAWLWNHAPHAQ